MGGSNMRCIGKVLGILVILALLTVPSTSGSFTAAQPTRILRETQPDLLVTVQQSTQVLPHDKMVCSDPTIPRGKSRILRRGVEGEVLRTWAITTSNGVEISRFVQEERVIRQPVTEILAIGSGPEAGSKSVSVTETAITLPTGEVLHYKKVINSLATAYCDKGLTATGTQARVGAIAVDPRVIPYGTRMFIMTADGSYIYGLATAEDCGSREHIYGTRIDLHMDTYYECRQFGARDCLVFILG